MDRNEEDKTFMKKKGKKHQVHYALNPASVMLCEDHLKKVLNKPTGQSYKLLKSTFAPRNRDSAFGDFPKEFITKKKENFDMNSIDSHQVAQFVTAEIRTRSVGGKVTPFIKPPKAGAFNPRKIQETGFRLHYDRCDLPILVEHHSGCRIRWKNEDWDKFDYQLYLPIFVDGIREVEDPYRFLAVQGTFDLLDRVKDAIVKVMPQLILPLKAALNTRDSEVICVALKVIYLINLQQVIQKLVTSSDLAGEALVPYYRQLLPIFNLYRNKNANLGDKTEYSQRKKKNIGDLIQETLEVMETHGGDVNYNFNFVGSFYKHKIYDSYL